jgi:hypothetical protein
MRRGAELKGCWGTFIYLQMFVVGWFGQPVINLCDARSYMSCLSEDKDFQRTDAGIVTLYKLSSGEQR